MHVMSGLVAVPGGAVVDERACLDEGAADDTRGAAELRADRHAAVVVVLGGAGTCGEAAGLLLLQRKYSVISEYFIPDLNEVYNLPVLQRAPCHRRDPNPSSSRGTRRGTRCCSPLASPGETPSSAASGTRSCTGRSAMGRTHYLTHVHEHFHCEFTMAREREIK